MVNFRLSEEEYQDLKELCMKTGARSVSDFARSAVCHFVGNGNGSAEQFGSAVQELRGRVEELDREMKRLAQLLAEPSAGSDTWKGLKTAKDYADQSTETRLAGNPASQRFGSSAAGKATG